MLDQFALLDLGAPQLLIILGIVVLLFGGKKLPELSRSIGEPIHEIKEGASSAGDIKREVTSQVNEVKSKFSVIDKPEA